MGTTGGADPNKPRDDEALRALLVEHLIAKTADTTALRAALHALDRTTTHPRTLELAEAVRASGRPALDSLSHQLERQLMRMAARAHVLRTSGRPWTPTMEAELSGLLAATSAPADGFDELERLARLRRNLDRAAADSRDAAERAYRGALEGARHQPLPWERVGLPAAVAPPRDAADEFVAASDVVSRRALLPRVMALPDDRVAHALETLDPREVLPVALALTIRAGTEGATPIAVIRAWRAAQDAEHARQKAAGRRLRDEYEAELVAICEELQPSVRHLLPQVAVAPAPPAPPPAPVAAPPPPPPPAPPPVPAPAAPPKPAKPSVWDEHIQPFLVENWHFAIGALMVVVGASLVAFFTWDRHWLVRYTVLPVLLGTFTATLAGLGGWLERRDDTLRGTAAVLRGAAIGLLPINFMTVALLAADPAIARPLLVVPLVAALYITGAGWGLRRWCDGVLPGLGKLLGGTLLGLCCLVILRPIGITLAIGEEPLRVLLGAGFYLGFAGVALAVFGFTSRLLTPAVARDKRVPWFFGATLILTLLQVFVWVHASMGQLPRVYTYAPMVIAAGALVLHVERRALHLVGADDRVDAESFLGFALILLGLLMAQMDPWVRVVGFAMAGTVWLWQAPPRRHPLHAWIGMTLVACAGASIGLLPGFPPEARPWLGIALALAAGWGGRAFSGRGKAVLASTARELQVALLVLTVPVAMLGQWRDRSEPLIAAAAILVVAGGLAWRAHREGRQRWLLTACVVTALALPYLGCVDMLGRSLHGNTMVFGLAVLSLLWIGLDRIAPSVQTRRARSTVLWFYGALAVAGMVLRVVIEGRTPGDLLWYRAFMDHAGPILAALALTFAAYWSRSLVPGAMAAVILILLFPELRSQYHDAFDKLGWGTGFGSACTGLALVAACFVLRASPRFRALGPGDRFLGATPFPLQRRDWTLFTWPLVASAIFLFAKILTVTFPNRLHSGEMSWKVAAAQCLAGGGWMLLAAYGRAYPRIKLAVYLGFVQLFIGVAAWDLVVARSGSPSHALLIYFVVVQVIFWVTRRHFRELIAGSARSILCNASQMLAPVYVLVLALVDESNANYLFSLFLALQLLWHGITLRRTRFGSLLFPLLWVGVLRLSLPTPRVHITDEVVFHLAGTTSVFVLALQALFAAAERRTFVYALIKPIAQPFQGWSALAIAGTAAVVLTWTMQVDTLHASVLVAAGVAAFATARATHSGLFALLGMALLYVLACAPALAGAAGWEERLPEVLMPWRWSMFGLGVAVLAALGHRYYARLPKLLAAPYPVRFDDIRPLVWLYGAAGLVAATATLLHGLHPDWVNEVAQLPAPFLGAVTFGVIGAAARRPRAAFGSAALFAIGNVHAVDVLAGPWLLDHGVSQLQIVCLGLSLTVIAGILVHRFTRRDVLAFVADRTTAVTAGFILFLLAAQYLAEPNVGTMTTARLLVSGAIAFAAAQAFRELARRARGEHAFPAAAAESAYHLGLTVSLWCLALLFPPLRQPSATLVALSVPFFFLLYRAESEHRAESANASRYRRSAMVLGFLLIGLIALRGVFQVVLFPGTPVLFDHYHHNSALLMLIGLGMVRLHALGGSYWVAFYGGLALIVGSYFAVTAFPGLSPFGYPVAAGWCMIAVGHFWTLASAERSPLRAGIQALGGIDDAVWHQIRTGWGYVVLGATQLPLLLAARAGADSLMLAPLLAGSATIVIHHGLRRGSRTYLLVAGAELLLALHFDFLVPSLVPKQWVVWIVLAAWGVMLTTRRLPRVAAYATAALVLGHVVYLDPASSRGLAAFGAATVLMLFTPQRSARWSWEDDGWTAGVLLAPTWLAYFAAVHAGYAHGAAWPVVVAAATVLATGAFAEWVRRQSVAADAPRSAVLFARLASLLHEEGARVRAGAVYAAFGISSAVFLLHYTAPYDTKSIYLLCAVFALCAAGFRLEGVERRAMLPYFLMQFAGLAFFAAIRRQLMLTTDLWTHEYDVWAACATSVLFAGAKEMFDLRPRESRVPINTAIFALPVVALIWTVVHGLGTNVALLVVGLNSLVFAFLGKDDRESPYNLVAVFGFVGFVLLTFWSKLELRSIQAFAVPVALGMLVLVQLFRARMSLQLVTRIRAVAVVAIVGSSAGEALLDRRYPIGFHVSLLVLSVAIMAGGSFLRVRVYLLAGAAGVLLGLGSITYRGLAGLERAAQMSAIGVLVLVIGTALVAGATYYKTHRETAHATLDRWRRKLGEWD